ncbi:MAG: hypothetical protein WDO13_18600 [Verrucomicrobiota bacterium]
MKASDAIEDTCKFTLETVKTPEDLDAQMAAITRLRAAQGDVVTFLQNYDQHCRDVLTRDGIAAGTQAEVIAGARKGAHVDLLIGLWQAKMKLSDDHIARFAFLRKNWGQWELTEGKVFFRTMRRWPATASWPVPCRTTCRRCATSRGRSFTRAPAARVRPPRKSLLGLISFIHFTKVPSSS